jgi:hypothetical protein
MTNKDKKQLEILQKKILKKIQGLPCRAANTGVYVLLGGVHVEMAIERNMLFTFISTGCAQLSMKSPFLLVILLPTDHKLCLCLILISLLYPQYFFHF